MPSNGEQSISNYSISQLIKWTLWIPPLQPINTIVPNNEQSLFFSIPSINDTQTTNKRSGKIIVKAIIYIL